MKNLVTIAKALADSNRVRAMWAVRQRALCVCQIVELLGLAPSTVSKHLSILQQAGLIWTEKRGRWIYCHVAKSKGDSTVKKLFAWMDQASEGDDQLKRDRDVLRRILKKDPEELCKRQRQTK